MLTYVVELPLAKFKCGDTSRDTIATRTPLKCTAREHNLCTVQAVQMPRSIRDVLGDVDRPNFRPTYRPVSLECRVGRQWQVVRHLHQGHVHMDLGGHAITCGHIALEHSPSVAAGRADPNKLRISDNLNFYTSHLASHRDVNADQCGYVVGCSVVVESGSSMLCAAGAR